MISRMITSVLALLVTVTGFANNDVEIRFGNVSADCDNNKLFVDVELNNPTNADYEVGSMTLRLTYNDQAVTNPQLDNATTAGNHFVREQDGIATYGIIDFSGLNTVASNNGWQKVGTMSFDIVSATQSIDLQWQEDNYPKSTMQEFVSNTETPNMNITTFGNMNVNVSAVCAQPINVNGVRELATCIDEPVELEVDVTSNNNELTFNWTSLDEAGATLNAHETSASVGNWETAGIYNYMFVAADPYFETNQKELIVSVHVKENGACKNGATPTIASSSSELSFEVNPNPSNGKFNLSYTLPAKTGATAFVYDALGKSVLFEMNLEAADNAEKRAEKVDLTGRLESGNYLVILKADNGEIQSDQLIIGNE